MNLNDPVSTIMAKDVECVSPSDKILEIKHIYESPKFHHHIPVTESGKLVGIVSLIDFMRRIGDATLDDADKTYHAVTVSEIMIPNPKTVSQETSIKEVLETLAKGEFHSIIVSEAGIVSGIVTTTDLLNYFLKES